MVYFDCDYSNGMHPEILQHFIDTNSQVTAVYGDDCYSESAKDKIRRACGCPEAQIYFAAGGTQTNMIVISSVLQDYQGVIAADSAHVSTHESGAIENSGNKVLTIPNREGKIKAEDLRNYCKTFYGDDNHEHMVYPGMVYISQPTEFGSLYSKSELEELYNICEEFNMQLYIDGARLAYGLMSHEADFTLEDIARLCHVFYIGGTKIGSIMGEAIVFTKNNMPTHFLNRAKKRGGLLAKGRVCGVAFDAFFTNDLYLRCGKNAIDMKDELVEVLKKHDFEFARTSPTNQQYVIMENGAYKKLKEKVGVSFWENVDDNHTVVRFCTSWSTTKEDLLELDRILTEEL